jgi:hypothetical protein
MDSYVQEILDVLWEIEGWKKDEMRNRVRVRKWLRQFPPDQVDLVNLAHKFDVWSESKEMVHPNVSNFDAFIRTLVRKGDVQPYRLTVSGAILSVQDQIAIKQEKRKRDLAALGVFN